MSEDKAIAVGHIPSGLFIVCAQNGDQIDGFLASWIQQVSFEPLLITLAMRPGRPASDLITDGKIFSINVVGEHEMKYLKHFWSGFDPEKKPFAEIEHKLTDQGAVLMTQARSTLVCQMKETLTPGDHTLVVAQVLESHVHHPESKSKVHLRKSGKDY